VLLLVTLSHHLNWLHEIYISSHLIVNYFVLNLRLPYTVYQAYLSLWVVLYLPGYSGENRLYCSLISFINEVSVRCS
jgi:hypothetical protein